MARLRSHPEQNGITKFHLEAPTNVEDSTVAIEDASSGNDSQVHRCNREPYGSMYDEIDNNGYGKEHCHRRTAKA